MNSTANPLTYRVADNCYGKACLKLPATTKKVSLQEEEVFGFSTIDGGVVTHKAGTKAISKGVGIFIGDYFVGNSDSYQSISNLPFVRY